jgi:steroid 5-alpha reductase family enzyme
MKSRRGDQVFVVVTYVLALLAALAVGRAISGRHPIVVAAAGDFAATVVVFFFSILLNNSSVYDPFWSVAPFPIVLYWTIAAPAGMFGFRHLLILALMAVWGCRLTANWARRWRGRADEDFRYREIREKTGRAYWPVSFVAIHLMPTIWVFLGLLPIFPEPTRSGLGISDILAALITSLAIATETIADRQLRNYLCSPHDPSGVLRSGLWSICRHPNYLGEILFWWGLFLFGIGAHGGWWWSVVGPLSITLLFVFVSVPWMDRRMLARHPAWADSMKKTPALLPWIR